VQGLLPGSWLFLQAEPFGGAAVDEDLGQRSPDDLVAGRAMILTPVQDQAIAARMALIVGSITFDRLFGRVRFDEVDGDVLFAYAKDEESAVEIEDTFALHISIIATDILKREIGVVMVLPKQTAR
jgi:hypothetical protein